MIVCYDLARCPPTYDAVAFLALAEAERLRRGEGHIDVHILPGPVGGFRRDGLLWPHSIEARELMRDRVLLPLCRLLPSVVSVSVHESNQEVQKVVGWGAGENYIGLPRIVEALRAGATGRPLRPLWCPEEPRAADLITFTLREAEHWPQRNSKTAEWLEAAEALRRVGFRVHVVRDTKCAAERIPHDCPRAARDILERARLYASAVLNVGVSNGPMWMSIFMDAPTLMLRPTTEMGGCYDNAFFAQYGIPRGGQLPASPVHQRLVWEDDTCDNIVQAVMATMSATQEPKP